MNADHAKDRIQELIRASRQRAMRETLAAIVVIAVAIYLTGTTPVFSVAYFGCMILIYACSHIISKVREYKLPQDNLVTHPVTNRGFWRGTYQEQAALLSRVPLWYLAPLFVGISLYFAPTASDMGIGTGTEQTKIFSEIIGFLAIETVLLIVFASIMKLNHKAARELRDEAQALLAE